MPAESILPMRPAPEPTPAEAVEAPTAREGASRKARTRARAQAQEAPRDDVALPPLLLLDMAGLSRLLSRSAASLYRDTAAGRIPAGRKLGGSKRWVYTEIVAWVEAGMPCRREWEARRAAGNGNERPRAGGR